MIKEKVKELLQSQEIIDLIINELTKEKIKRFLNENKKKK